MVQIGEVLVAMGERPMAVELTVDHDDCVGSVMGVGGVDWVSVLHFDVLVLVPVMCGGDQQHPRQ